EWEGETLSQREARWEETRKRQTSREEQQGTQEKGRHGDNPKEGRENTVAGEESKEFEVRIREVTEVVRLVVASSREEAEELARQEWYDVPYPENHAEITLDVTALTENGQVLAKTQVLQLTNHEHGACRSGTNPEEVHQMDKRNQVGLACSLFLASAAV